MFVRPEQVASFVAHHPEVLKARVVITRAQERDQMTVMVESPNGDPAAYTGTVIDTLKLRAAVDVVAPGSLPRDGLVIEDLRPRCG